MDSLSRLKQTFIPLTVAWLTRENCKHDLLLDSTGTYCVWVVLQGYGTVRWLSAFDVGNAQAIEMARRVVKDRDAKAVFVRCVDLSKVQKRLFKDQQDEQRIAAARGAGRMQTRQSSLF